MLTPSSASASISATLASTRSRGAAEQRQQRALARAGLLAVVGVEPVVDPGRQPRARAAARCRRSGRRRSPGREPPGRRRRRASRRHRPRPTAGGCHHDAEQDQPAHDLEHRRHEGVEPALEQRQAQLDLVGQPQAAGDRARDGRPEQGAARASPAGSPASRAAGSASAPSGRNAQTPKTVTQ